MQKKFKLTREKKEWLDKTKKKSLSKPQASAQKDDWTKLIPQGIKVKSVDIKEVPFEPQSPNSRKIQSALEKCRNPACECHTEGFMLQCCMICKAD